MFAWGDGSREQLPVPLPGGGSHVGVPTQVLSCRENVVGAACGEDHSLLLTAGGRVLSCGRNNKGQLGRKKRQDAQLSEVKELQGVSRISCGQNHCLALVHNGKVYSWGAGDEGQLGIIQQPSKIPHPRLISLSRIVQVACGRSHSLALSKEGQVFSWGRNSHGQLGLSRNVHTQSAPAPVPALTGVPVVQIAAGGSQTFAISLQGFVYCCGANNAGQLGLNRTDDKGRFTICKAPALSILGVCAISCGEAHTAVLTEDGQVFTFGEGSQGQLGHNSTANEVKPRKVEGINNPVSQIACGSHHTLVLVCDGRLLAFGSGVKGQLGNGTSENCLQPIEVQQAWKNEHEEMNDFRISAGWKSNFIFPMSVETSLDLQPAGKLNDAQVQTWLTMQSFDSAEAKSDFYQRFSTSSSFVASFTKDRSTLDRVKVDVNTAAEVLNRLMEIPWIRTSVRIKIEQLIKNLCAIAPDLIAVDIFLILPTCPLLHEDENVLSLVLPLALAVSKLNRRASESLTNSWEVMEPTIITKHIQVWKRALSYLINCNMDRLFIPHVKALLQVLKQLYKVNKKAEESRQVHISEFCVEEVLQLLQEDVALWYGIKCSVLKESEDTPAIFCRYPFLLSLQSKIFVLRFTAAMTQSSCLRIINNQWVTDVFQLRLSRTSPLEDAFRQLAAADDQNFKKYLQVRFDDDVKPTLLSLHDFFHVAFEELLAPKSDMFMYNDTKTLVWFPANVRSPGVVLVQHFLFGVLCGLALNNNNVVHMPFHLALFKKLVGMKPTLEDLVEFSPVVGKSLRYLLHDYTDDDVENMDLSFLINWDGKEVELDPKEKGRLVISANKKEFVSVYVEYTMNKSVEKVFEEFKMGFFKVCDIDVVGLFQPNELREILSGTEEYNWEVFKQNTEYEMEFHRNHPNIIWFWEVFEDLSHDQKKTFLLFLTGCERVPILGLGEVRMMIRPLVNSTEEHCPESMTCHSFLWLPTYETKEKLKNKLTEALTRGFLLKPLNDLNRG
ncbi:probable E3 ubiquitin-protein ligase HERC6 [Denticeps clupeoides]|uniref:probable E3 ubiquitin-protein ligase HERC6 n=1 Tax=Denticeps clupeoides TaxID=299321 RepID=UPI0010A2C4E0|nr:probable E3 ubiquitin-protein ligase HERC6 [Denticeps clupeoides]